LNRTLEAGSFCGFFNGSSNTITWTCTERRFYNEIMRVVTRIYGFFLVLLLRSSAITEIVFVLITKYFVPESQIISFVTDGS
jgi:hypothetical protein